MHQGEFLAQVRERGEYVDQAEAERVTRAVLEVLASRIQPSSIENVASQLPGDLAGALDPGDQIEADNFGVQEFCRRVSQVVGTGERIAEWDAAAVLSTLAVNVSGGLLNQVLSGLPSGYASLFGHPELSE